MNGDWFVYALIFLNAGAMVSYSLSGNWNKTMYWAAVIILNWSLLRMK